MADYTGSNFQGNQLFRQQPYIQIGQNYMRKPTSIDLDEMFQAPQTPATTPFTMAPPELPAYTPEMPAEGMAEGGIEYEQWMLEHADEWEKLWVENIERWMPKNPAEGQIYDDPGGERFLFKQGRWTAGVGNITFFEGESRSLYENYTMGFIGETDNYTDWLARFAAYGFAEIAHGTTSRYGRAPVEQIIAEMRLQGMSAEDIKTQVARWADTYRSPEQAKQLLDAFLVGKHVETEDFGFQIEELFKRINSGEDDEISIYNAEGMLDLEALSATGNAGQWIADMLQQGVSAGYMEDEFTTADGELSPEIMDIVNSVHESMFEQTQEVNRALMLNALSRGLSVNDTVFSKERLAWNTETTAQFANILQEQMMTELEAAYTSIGNSMVNMLKQMGDDTAAATFQAQINAAMEQTMLDYQAQMAAIAEEMAQSKSARAGQIFSGILSAVVAALMIL